MSNPPTDMERLVAASLWNTHLRRWRDHRALAKVATPDEFLDYARAAIRAMRDPTDAMLDAAEKTGKYGGISDSGAAEPNDFDPFDVWTAMIEAASPE